MVSFKDLSRKILAPIFFAASIGLPTGALMAQELNETDLPPPATEQTVVEDNSYIDWYNPPENIDPKLFAGFLLAGGLLYGGLMLYGGRKGMRGSFLRAAAGGAVLFALCNPQVVDENLGSIPTDVLILTDVTASQELGERSQETEDARAALIEALSASGNINVRTIEVDNSEGDLSSGGTQVFGALQNALSNIPRDRLGAVVVITDGQIHDAPEMLSELGVDAPLHALITGRDTDYDRSIIIDQSPVFGPVGESRTVTFHVEDQGNEPQEEADRIEVNVKVGGEIIDTLSVEIGEQVEYEVDITSVGENVIVFEADTIEGELTDINNRVVTTIRGIEESLNLLVISGNPHRGFTMLRDLYWSDPDVNPAHYTTLRTPLQQDYTPFRETALMPFPKYEIFVDKLAEFDLVIMDNVSNTGFIPEPYFRRLAEYVEQGGAMLVLTDPNYQQGDNQNLYDTPLSSVLNVNPTSDDYDLQYRPEIGIDGYRHPITRPLVDDQEAGWGSWTYQNFGTVEGEEARVLMEGAQGNPLLVISENGEGRVATITSNSLWLWANNYQGGGPHAELIGNTTEWLMGNPSMEEEQLNLNMRGDVLNITVQTMEETPAIVTVLTPTGEEITPELEFIDEGLWRAQVTADQIGEYLVQQEGEDGLTSTIQIGPSYEVEYISTVSTTAVLDPVIADQGYIGRVVDEDGIEIPKIQQVEATAAETAGEDWLGVRMNDETVVLSNDRESLIPGWFGYVIAGLFAAGFLRRRTGFNFGFGREDEEPVKPAEQKAKPS